MKKIIQTAFIFLFVSIKAHAGSTWSSESYFTGSVAESKAACLAHALSLGYTASHCIKVDGRVYGGNWCKSGTPELLYCGQEPGNIDYIMVHYYYPKYTLSDYYDNNQGNMCVGNPIDPVSGSKIQKESLISTDGIQPIKLDLFYNSANLDKWKHSYSRSLSFSIIPTGNRYDTGYADANGFNPVAEPESNSFLGGVSSAYGKKNLAPKDFDSYLTKEEACVSGWSRFKDHYKFSWVNSSVAEYRLRPISSYGAIGQCYILDAPEGDVKLVLDITELFSGNPGGGIYQQLNNGEGNRYLRFIRESGEVIVFSELENYKNISKTGETLDVLGSGTDLTYKLHTKKDEIEEYSKEGKLLSITSTQGHVQSLTYDTVTGQLSQVSSQTGGSLTLSYEAFGDTGQYSRIKTITDHTGRLWSFNYDTTSHTLTSIDIPGGTVRQYHYEDLHDLQLLTGITDETGTRYATWAYNADGRATLSAHGEAQDKDRVELSYLDNVGRGLRMTTAKRTTGISSGLDLDIVSTYKTHTVSGNPIVAEVTGVNPIKYEHNALTGHLEYKIEDPGTAYQQRTEYSNYDTKGNPGTIKEAVNTAEQRETIYTYDPRYHSKVATITEASVFPGNQKVTTNQYDDFGNNTAITISGFRPDGTTVTRSTTFQYNGPYHQLTQIDGPRTDVSDIYTIDYYPDEAAQGNNRARMKRVTAPLGITLYDNITYTGTGKTAGYTDANNVQTTLSYYYGNDRLQSLSQLDFNTTENRLTEWTYLATGEVKTITTGNDPADKTTLTLNYDDARRLTSIVDGLGNTIKYTIDSEGNVEQESIIDSAGDFKKQLTQTFDYYNRLQLRTQINETYTETWSPDGTLDKAVDGKNVTTDYSYDNLKRLTQINQDMGGTSPQTENALTILNYDVQDNLTYVKNPVNGETIYSYDDLGNQLSLDSNDTGLTIYSHDDAGNITSMLNANGETISYRYDALNRLITTATGNAADDYLYEYDNCQNGAGRLCKVSNNNSAQFYKYDAFGNVASQQVLQYTYDSANRLETISYPSGALVRYDYDDAGQVLQVTLERNGSSVPLASNINYEAFGDISNLLYGNTLTLSQSRDSAYRPLTQSMLSVFEFNYTQYDANGNLTQRDDAIAGSNSIFGYDAHNRLTTATGDFGVRSYEYDRNANRTKLTEDALSTSSSYDPASNRLSMRGVDNANLDSNGNMLDLGDRGYSYTKHNRLFEVFDHGLLKATYQYNGLGQRISKTLPDGSGKYFIYDTDGKLMAETDINGNVLFEYIYLNGQLLAKYSPDSDSDGISNAEEEHLGTNPLSPDSDNDGLADLAEMFVHGTSVSNADTDADGVSDGEEVSLNSDPLNVNIAIGDINLDGKLNLGDYVLLSQYVLDIRIPTPTEQAQADINQDGVLNIQDMLLMQRTLLGLQISSSDFSADNIERIFAELYQGIIPPAYAAVGDGQIYYVHNDHLGTPVKMTNAMGLVVWQAMYDPFGKASVNEDVDGDGKAVEMNMRFPGQYYDVESGLHYNYFRTYDPELGRYITSDPIGLQGGINTYSYAAGSPLMYVDPLGLATFHWHGNWGGPGHVNGKTYTNNTDRRGRSRGSSGWRESDGFPRYGEPGFVKPEDNQDAAYYLHDVCLNNCENSQSCGTKTYSKCQSDCDNSLANNPYVPKNVRIFFKIYRHTR
jgi:RHS repeat-associated protein